MSKYFLDTNTIIDLFSGRKNIINGMAKPTKIFISIISVAEYLSNQSLSRSEIKQFHSFCKKVEIVNFSLLENPELIDLTVTLRKKYRRKLPDTIIASSAICKKAILISSDRGFEGIKELKFQLS